MTTAVVHVPGDLTNQSAAKQQDTAGLPATFDAVRAVTTVGALQLAVLVVTLVRSKVLALLLHPEGVGIVSTIDQLVQFIAQVSALSLIPTPTRFISRAVTDGLAAVNTMYSALLKLLLASTVAGAAVATGLLYLQPHVLGASLVDYRSIAVVAVLSAPVFALSGFFANVSAAVKGYSTTSLYLLFAALASLAAVFIGVRTGGITGLYYANLIAGGLGVLAFARYLHANVPLRFRLRDSRLRDAFRQHPDIVAYCSTSYVLSFAQPLAFLVIRSMMLQGLGPAEAGYFQAAFLISSLGSMILMQAIRVYLEPRVNIAIDNRSRIAAANEFQRTFAVLILMGALPLVLFPRVFIAAIFTPAFTPVAGVIFVFVLADCLFLCNQVYATVLMAADDFRGFFHAQFAGLVCLCIGVWLLAGRFGLAGVAWSFVLSRLVAFVLIQRFLFERRQLRMTRRSAGVVAYAMAAVLGAGLVFANAPIDGSSGIAIRLLVFGGGLGGTLAFLTRDERTWLGAACRRALARPLAFVTRT